MHCLRCQSGVKGISPLPTILPQIVLAHAHSSYLSKLEQAVCTSHGPQLVLPGANCVDSGEADAERPRLDRIRVSLDGPTHTVHVFSCETVKHDRLCKLKRLQDKLATLTISHVL